MPPELPHPYSVLVRSLCQALAGVCQTFPKIACVWNAWMQRANECGGSAEGEKARGGRRG